MSPATRCMRAGCTLLAFAAGAIVAAAGIRQIAPFAGVDQIETKLAWYSARSAGCDTLLVGSSRVYHGIDPAVFDQTTAAAGHATRSFNFGIDGMFAPEDSLVLEAILKRRGSSLRWVVLELGLLHNDFAGSAPEARRTVHWHDWRRTRRVCRDLLSAGGGSSRWKSMSGSGPDADARRAYLARHAQLFLKRTFNVGRGTAILGALGGSETKAPPEILGPKKNGFVPTWEGRKLSGDKLEKYNRMLARRLATPAPRVAIAAELQANLDEMIAAVRHAGATPVVVISPTLLKQFAVPEARTDAAILNFSDPRRYPELLSPDAHADQAHLNPAGARLYSRLIAERFVETIRQFAPPP